MARPPGSLFVQIQPALLAAPGVALALAGLLHPHHLTYATAPRWTVLHVVALFVFPLVGLALAQLVRGRGDPLAWLVRLAAFGYATAYTALDVVSGATAGYITWRRGAGAPRPEEVNYVFALGNDLGEVGGWALVLAALAVVVDGVRRLGWARGVPGVVTVVGALLVEADHIYAPWGALGILLVGLGTGWLSLASPPRGPGARARR